MNLCTFKLTSGHIPISTLHCVNTLFSQDVSNVNMRMSSVGGLVQDQKGRKHEFLLPYEAAIATLDLTFYFLIPFSVFFFFYFTHE